MSMTVDEKVVEMRFDNKNFETNVSTTLNTLDKLKNSLKLDDAAKGLDAISSSAKKIDFSHAANGVETFNVKMKALDVAAATIFSNITNAAMRTASNIVSALAIEPVTTGLQEYETQIGAIQTILSNTRSAGTTIDDVNKALATLNTYADKTIYNFTEMTRNIGTFTAAGVDLQTSVESIQGIANLAAVSGSTAQQASTAMYQLSQALATGTVKLQDWNSVVNAGMGGQVFQEALKRTASAMGTNVDELIEKYGSFRDSLTQGQWLTTEVLTETLKQLAGAYSEADLIHKGYSKQQAKDIMALADDATKAATKVKTFTQLIDTLKEASQSGWTQTWQIIVGDFYEARQLFTGVSDAISGVIGALSDARNGLLTDALTSKWKILSDQIKEAGITEADFQEQLGKNVKGGSKALAKILETEETLNNAISHGKISADDVYKTIKQLIGVTDQTEKSAKKATKVTKEMRDVVKKVINGEFGDGEERIEAIEKAGFKYKEVQELVNKALKGETLELKGTSKAMKDTSKLTEEQKKKLEELRKSVGDSGSELEDLIAKLNRPSGRELLFESLFNIASGLYSVIEAAAKSFAKLFADPERGEKIYQVLVKINAATDIFKSSLQFVSSSFYSVFAGLFDILSVIAKVVTGPFRIAVKVLGSFLSSFDGITKRFGALNNASNILVAIGEGLSNIAKWANKGKRIDKAIDGIAAGIVEVISGLRKVISDFLGNPKVKSGLDWIINKFKEFVSMGSNIIDGLIKGISSKGKELPNVIISIATSIIDTIKNIFDMHSPSKVTEGLGENIVEGLINGIKKAWSGLLSLCDGAIERLKDTFDKIDFTTIFEGGLSIGLLALAKKLTDIIGSITKPLDGLGDLLSGTGKVLDKSAKPIAKTIKSLSKVFTGFSKVLKAYAFKMKAKALIDIAIAIAILAGSIAALAFVAHQDPKALQEALKTFIVIGIVLAGLAVAIDKMSKSVDKLSALNFNTVKLGATMIMVAGSIAIIALAIKSLAGIKDPKQAQQGFLGLAGIMVAMGIFMAAMIKINSIGGGAVEIDKAGKMMLKVSIAMLIMVKVVKMAGELDPKTMNQGLIFIGAFVAFILALMIICKLDALGGKGGLSEIGSSMLKLVVAMGLMVLITKLIGRLKPSEMGKAALFATGFALFIKALMLAVKGADIKNVKKLSVLMIAVSSSLRIMASATKILGEMDLWSLTKGVAAIAILTQIIGHLLKVVKESSGRMNNVSVTLIALSVALAIMAGTTVVMGMISLPNLAKGLVAMGFLSAFMSMMIMACRAAQDVKGNLIVLTAAIAVMTASLIALSMLRTDKLIPAMASLATIMGMMSLMIFTASKLDKKSLLPLVAVLATLVVAAGSLYILSKLPMKQLVAASASLSLVLLALSASLFIISKSGNAAVKALAVMGGLVVVIATLGYVLYTLAQIPTKRMFTVASSLALVMGTLAVSLAIIGLMKKNAYIALPVLFALVGATALLGEVIKGLIQNDPIGAINAAKGLSILLGTLTACLVILGVVPTKNLYQGVAALTIMVLIMGLLSEVIKKILAMDIESKIQNLVVVASFLVMLSSICAMLSLMPISSAASAVANLAILIGGFTAIVVALGAISRIPGFNDLLGDGGKVIQKLGEIIGGFVGGIIAGFGKAVTSALPQMGMDLSMFMINLTPFIAGARQLDDKVLSGVKSLADAILTICKAEVLSSILQWVSGGKSISEFGTMVSEFGDIIINFGKKVKDIDPKTIQAASKAGKNLAEMLNTMPTSGGLKEKIFGSTDFGSFKKNILEYADVIKEFSKKFTDVDLNTDSMKKAVNAGKSITELINQLPASGGWKQSILGSKDLSTFSEAIRVFGSAIVNYGKNAAKLDDEKLTAISNSVSAGKYLTELANSLPKADGFVQSILGNKDLAAFGERLRTFGSAIVTYGDTVYDLDIQAVLNSRSAIDGFVEIATTITRANVKNFKNFGKNLRSLGQHLKEYYGFISMIDFAAVNASLTSIRSMVTTFSKMENIDSSKISSFINGLSSVNSSDLASAADNMSSLGASMTSGLSSSISKSGDDVASSMGGVISSAVKSSKQKASAFVSVGRSMVTKMVHGIKCATSIAANGISLVTTSAAKAIRKHHSSFVTNGRYLGEGLVDGIKAKWDDAYSAGFTLGKKAAQGEKDGQKSKSPSKLTYQAGIWLGEGLINGIKAIGNKVYNTSKEMGATSADRLSSALSGITNVLDDDFSMNPVITPVVDMSNINASSDRISRLLNGNSSIGINSNLNAISRSLSLRQNELSNNDVVRAINKLGTKMDGLGNVTNIGAITYDDGSNINQAVSALAKAAIMEGRT